MDEFDRVLSGIVDSTLGFRCKLFGYQYSEIIRSLMCVYFCGGTCIAVINNMIVGIENRDGNTNVRFHQQDTLERMFLRLEAKGLKINQARMDCGSCSEEIVKIVEKHCKHFYIRANRCSSLYDDIFALRGWKKEVINDLEFELNSIL